MWVTIFLLVSPIELIDGDLQYRCVSRKIRTVFHGTWYVTRGQGELMEISCTYRQSTQLSFKPFTICLEDIKGMDPKPQLCLVLVAVLKPKTQDNISMTKCKTVLPHLRYKIYELSYWYSPHLSINLETTPANHCQCQYLPGILKHFSWLSARLLLEVPQSCFQPSS